jgi:hypothetical protein
MSANMQMSKSQFSRIIRMLCQTWHVPGYHEYLTERYWPAFSQLDDAGQRAFWTVLGVEEDTGTEDRPCPL